MQQVKAQHISSGSGYDIGQSCLFDGGSLSSSLGTSSAFTASFWVKRSEFGSAQKILGDTFGFLADDTIVFNGTGTQSEYRDPSAWMHIVLAGTGMSNGYLYINGILHSGGWEGPITPASIGLSLKGYLSDFYFIDGQSLGPEMFALEDSDGVWNPIPYTGDYGTNGFHLEFGMGDETVFTEGTHTFRVDKESEAEVLIVAGGGSSGGGDNPNFAPGGGGAGGMLKGTTTLTPGDYTIEVGAGGASPGSNKGNNGANSSISEPTWGTAIAIGGGGGGRANNNSQEGLDGGSGGGSGGQYDKNPGQPLQSNSNGLTGYGNVGGRGCEGCNNSPSGAGGGAGGPAWQGNQNNDIQPGPGLEFYGDSFGLGGSGKVNSGSDIGNATPGTGNGGASPGSNKPGNAGGSGKVIIKISPASAGKDTSGNGNDFETTGITPDNIVADSPTNNYCTLNPLDITSSTYSDGNLTTSGNATVTFADADGKWYYEKDGASVSLFDPNAVPNWNVNSDSYGADVVSAITMTSADDVALGENINVGMTVTGDGRFIVQFNESDNRRFRVNQVGCYFSTSDNGVDWEFRGSSDSTDYTVDMLGRYYTFACSPTTAIYTESAAITRDLGVTVDGSVGTVDASTYNFGQRPFAHTPPAGYKALCTDNLPNPLVDPRKNFSVNLWSGVAGDQLTGFEPNLVWIKSRDEGGMSHQLIDSVRGATKSISSNSTADEQTQANGLMSFNSDGFTAGAETGYMSPSMVSWNFKAGGPAVTNNDGSIPSEVSVNKDMGFSVVKYRGNEEVGDTVGHGLGTIPSMIIFKGIGREDFWPVVSEPVGWDKYLRLNSSVPEFTGAIVSGAPTSSVINLGIAGSVNYNTDDYIAYCFANTEMIHVGQYTGNSSVDGPFVNLPFKPAYSMIKMIQPHDGYNWLIFDNKRNPYNVVGKQLMANESSQESDSPKLDFLSNGFKLRDSSYNVNVTGCTYLYLAISEQNFKNSRGR